MKSTVIEIGSQALGDKEPIIIFFGETVTEGLKAYSVIQKIVEPEEIELKKGDQLKIDDQVYSIEHVGSFANANLNSIAHVTMVFDQVPEEDAIANGIYLSPETLPKIKVGTILDYISTGE